MLNQDIVSFCDRVAAIHTKSVEIKKDAISLGEDLIAYVNKIEQDIPPSDSRDRLIAAITGLKKAITTLGALPSVDISELPNFKGTG